MTVAVATFGAPWWRELAHSRAIPSVRECGLPVVYAHAGTLHDARNAALAQVQTPWVVHLDADDEIEAGYADAMATGTADVRAPAVRYIRRGGASDPAMPHVSGHGWHECEARCLPAGNWIVIGAMVRSELVRRVGGWRDYSWSEDWDMWLRCYLAGATFEPIPAAIYRAHVRPGSRNRSGTQASRLRAHRLIAAANGVPSP